ncbi:NHL repeat protein [Azoarcus sp. Aa7]|nr:NHL repeat protein [Azoarcus sp. Aa7]
MLARFRLLCLLFALAGCSAAVIAPQPNSSLPVWPPEPDPARIAYVASISRPDDLGIAKGFLQRLRDAVLGADDTRLVRPMAVVVVGKTLFVADPGARGVHRFDPVGGGYDLVRGPGGAPLPSPVALARGGDGEVYVSDSRLGRVLVIRSGETVAQPVRLDAPLRQPTGLAFDAETGRLYVVDTAAHRIEVFDRDGARVASFGRRGEGPGEFNYPSLLWRASDGRLYVTDSLNFRVQILDPYGGFVGSFGQSGDGSGDTPRPKGVATDSHGHVYVADALFNAVQIFDGAGRFLLSLGGQGQGAGEFWLPAGLFIDGERIYVADSYNGRVQVLRYVGGAT